MGARQFEPPNVARHSAQRERVGARRARAEACRWMQRCATTWTQSSARRDEGGGEISLSTAAAKWPPRHRITAQICVAGPPRALEGRRTSQTARVIFCK
eukprot:4814337-Pleurochrysis_carterae.AAC.3